MEIYRGHANTFLKEKLKISDKPENEYLMYAHQLIVERHEKILNILQEGHRQNQEKLKKDSTIDERETGTN